MTKGKRQVRADLIAGARPATSSAGAGAAPPPPPPPAYLTKRFHVRDDGVWKDQGEDKPQLWVCPRLEPKAETQDSDGFFAMLWAWRDRFGRERQELFQRDQFTGEASEVCKAMAARGLTSNPDRAAKQAFVEYLALASTTTRAWVVYRAGWHSIEGVQIYVLGDGTVYGKSPLRVILQSAARGPDLFQQSGTARAWSQAIGQKGNGNPRLALSIAMGFAPALLSLINEDGGGINLFGDSRSGKTTCALCSASVYGGDPAGGGARAAIGTWRATSNSTEAIAAAHSDVGWVIDELGQADGRDVGATAYMIFQGRGKDRLDRGVGLRAALTWRCLFLSTGELTLAAKMAEAGVKMRAGQGVRLIDLPADEGCGNGAFRELHDADNAGAFAQELRESAARFYGTAFRVFIAYVVGRLEREPTFRDWLRDEIDRLSGAWLAPLGGHNGQLATVCRRFALIAVAGNLATDAGLTWWGVMDGQPMAEWASMTCFQAWLAEREAGAGSHEDAQAVAQLRNFIALHGGNRFDDWGGKPKDGDQDESAALRNPRFRTPNRVGYRKLVDTAEGQEYRYFVSVPGMHLALEGLNFKAALKVLGARNLILADDRGELCRSIRVPGDGNQRLYEVVAGVMSASIASLPAIEK